MTKSTDVRVVGARLYFLPVHTRLPLKFGPEITTSVTCARACLTVADCKGRAAEGWGETPLSVQWVWPSRLSYEARHEALKAFCILLAEAWTHFDGSGHAMEVGHDFQEEILPVLLARFNQSNSKLEEPMPLLAALVCCSVFDVALHDAYGQIHEFRIVGFVNGSLMNLTVSIVQRHIEHRATNQRR